LALLERLAYLAVDALGDARADGKRTVLMRISSEEGTRFVAVPLG
jgi:hypothetical protein